MSIERSSSEVSRAAESLRSQLEARGIQASVGKSAMQGANVNLWVNFQQDTKSEKVQQVPNEIDGIPVKVKFTGRAFPQ